MDGLEDFEKALEAERSERARAGQEKDERRERKHRHHHRNHHSRRERTPEREAHGDRDRHRQHRTARSEDTEEQDTHRHKRSRHDENGDDEVGQKSRRRRDKSHSRERDGNHEHRRRGRDPKDTKATDLKEGLPLPDEELAPEDEARDGTSLARDAWMTAPSALDIDYVNRASKQKGQSTQESQKPQETRILHKRELNTRLANNGAGDTAEEPKQPESQEGVDYKFGDAGSQWRMTKLKAVYNTAEQAGKSVEEVALERFGSLKAFDDAREEKTEMERRKVYGEGYIGKEKPTGELYRERQAATELTDRTSSYLREPEPEQGLVVEDMIQPAVRLDQTALNRLRAQMMKAKLRRASDAAKLEAEYNEAAAAFAAGSRGSGGPVVLDAQHSRMLAGARGEVQAVDNKRGRERGLVEANEDMSIEDMVREERRSRGQAGGEGMRLAERIAKDVKFDDDLDYLDENAEKLARRVHKSEANLKNMAVSEFQKLNRILDSCPLCHHEDKPPPQNLPRAPVVSLATRVFLTLPTEPELTGAEGGAVIVPINHRKNLLECDEDEWEEMRNFMKSLTRLYHEQGREVLFYENAAAPNRHPHAALVAVPIPYDQGDTAPAFFREAMLSADEEWAQHRKIIDTGRAAREGMGKMAFRRSIAQEMPYFHVWFTLDGGLGHIVEDASRWPRGDLFAREVIGGMLDCEPDVIKRQGRWNRSDDRVEGFQKRWRKFDWTRVLTENSA